MHIFLIGKVPGMPLVPDTYDELAAIKEPCSSEFGGRICFVPNDKLKSVKNGVKKLVPLA